MKSETWVVLCHVWLAAFAINAGNGDPWRWILFAAGVLYGVLGINAALKGR